MAARRLLLFRPSGAQHANGKDVGNVCGILQVMAFGNGRKGKFQAQGMEKVFGIKANLLSRQFDSDVWEEFIRNRQDGGSVAQTFQNMGIAVQERNHSVWIQ